MIELITLITGIGLVVCQLIVLIFTIWFFVVKVNFDSDYIFPILLIVGLIPISIIVLVSLLV